MTPPTLNRGLKGMNVTDCVLWDLCDPHINIDMDRRVFTHLPSPCGKHVLLLARLLKDTDDGSPKREVFITSPVEPTSISQDFLSGCVGSATHTCQTSLMNKSVQTHRLSAPPALPSRSCIIHKLNA